MAVLATATILSTRVGVEPIHCEGVPLQSAAAGPAVQCLAIDILIDAGAAGAAASSRRSWSLEPSNHPPGVRTWSLNAS